MMQGKRGKLISPHSEIEKREGKTWSPCGVGFLEREQTEENEEHADQRGRKESDSDMLEDPAHHASSEKMSENRTIAGLKHLVKAIFKATRVARAGAAESNFWTWVTVPENAAFVCNS
jgi:hypothetical protein